MLIHSWNVLTLLKIYFNKCFSKWQYCISTIIKEYIVWLTTNWKLLNPYFYFQSMTTSKNLIREVEKKKLHEVNEKECDLLVERWQSDECMNAIMAFFTRKSNL